MDQARNELPGIITMTTLKRNTTITYLGHSTLLIETPGGRRILIDPWTAGNPACPAEWKDHANLGTLDVVFVTHIHNDHVGDAEAIIRANPGVLVIGIFEACNWLKTKGATNTRPMSKGEPAGYILRMENGFTMYAAGDTGVFGDMALIQELYHPDLAFLPIGDLFTMGPEQAALAARLLGVKHVVPIHYATFPALTGTVEALREHTKHLPDLTIHELRPGETLR